MVALVVLRVVTKLLECLFPPAAAASIFMGAFGFLDDLLVVKKFFFFGNKTFPLMWRKMIKEIVIIIMFTIAFSLLLVLITIMMIRVIIKSMMIISYRGTSLKWPYESSLSSSSSSLLHDRQNHGDHDDHCKSAFDRERHSDGRYGAVGTSISQHQAH